MKFKAVHVVLLGLCTAQPAWAQGSPAELTDVIGRYLARWNAHDARTLTRDYLALPPSHPWSTEAGMAAMFTRLKAEGYSHSTVSTLSGCLTGSDTGKVELRYARVDTKGRIILPADRMTIYELRKGPGGWRVTAINPITGTAQSEGMRC